ncbi:DUF924 family protein [Croceicoccus naphthovorans]|uniref:DUF924 family protein n=1 Tax=Croceicoccus naphthovorans TaxID=1348774 RepID=UPI00069D28E3|nr:DUF924 family protein [Croceicoccus naphthovorans]MBB3990573.1 uncharacterized protein (DUF924 family) [Croceicoccus naphthovorans]
MAVEQPWLEVLDFWFRELAPAQWFDGGSEVDAMICRQFGPLVEEALAGDLNHWAQEPRGRLGLIILIDQFTRNVFRGQARAFSGDGKAQTLVLEGLEHGADKVLTLSERQFFYMPLMHAEDSALQDRSVALFAGLVDEVQAIADFARGHRNVVGHFGRFPMRNDALGRADTAGENAYLRAGGGYPVGAIATGRR